MGHSFDWLHQCLYCGGPCNIVKDSKHPNWWNPAYLVREVEKKASDGPEKAESIEKKIKEKCYERADEWAGNILVRLAGLTVRAADLHAADARYHRDCYVRFFSDRSLPGDTKKKESSTGSSHALLQLLVDELQSQRSQRWDSVWLMERFKTHPTPLQIALGVLFNKKKTIKHMHDYLVCCSYEELLRFKQSSAVGKYLQICSQRRNPVSVEGLVQVIVDNFDAELSSPNGLVSTHELATIETHSKPLTDKVPGTIAHIRKTDMTNPICFEEDDDIIIYNGTEKPLLPPLPPHDLPDEYFDAQHISYERADNMDFTFFKEILCSLVIGNVV